MKVTVELSDQEMTEILELTGERKKGPAIRRLMEEALQQRRRAQIAQRCLAHKPYAQRLRPVRPSWQRSTKTEPVLQRGLPAQQLVIAPRRIQGSSPSIRPPSARCTAPSARCAAPSNSCPGHCCKPSPRVSANAFPSLRRPRRSPIGSSRSATMTGSRRFLPSTKA